MAHRSGGGSHSGGHHSGGGHHGGGRGGSGGLTYSKTPFQNARRLRYYDRKGRERYIYCDGIPQKTGKSSLITPLLFLIPFVLVGLYTLISPLFSIMPPKPLNPVYGSTDVHIMDEAGLIDNKDSLESVLREFEDKTGISPYVMTAYDEDWEHFGELYDYAYYIYINNFPDEQHFLIVYSEPENAAELDFVDWSWEGVQGDDTDPILTESKVERFGNDLQDNLLRNDVSVGEAFKNAFEQSLTYIMGRNNDDAASAMLLCGIICNLVVIFFAIGIIHIYTIENRDYQEVPMEGSSDAVPGAMGDGNNTAYQNGTTFQDGQMHQNSQVYQSNTNNMKKYMYYDKNGNKKYVSSSIKPTIEPFATMLLVLFVVVPYLFKFILFLWKMILMIQEIKALGEEIPLNITTMFVSSLIWTLALFIIAFVAIRRYLVHKNRDYIDVTGTSALNNEGMTNNSAADNNFYNDEAGFRGSEDYNDARYHGSNAYESSKK